MSRSAPLVHHPDEAEEYETPERCRILETWNREDDSVLSIARARVAAGTTTRVHRLRGITERYYVLSGRGLVEVGGQPPRVVARGDLVYIPAGCAQRIGNEGPDDLVFLAVCTPRYMAEAYEDIDPESRS
jgi:mannose-6-phosphate isomerase-like protein (cupin superfamily)